MIFCSIHVWYNLPKIGRQGTPPPPPTGLRCWNYYRWRLRLQGPVWWKMIFSMVFMFSTIYLRSEGKVAPPRIEMLEPLQMESDITRLPEWRRWLFSITFMFSPIYLRRCIPPLHPELNLDLRWVRSMSAFYNLPPLSITYFMPEKKLVNFNFIWTFKNLNFLVGVGYFYHTL